mmetsp:Transcript_25900/g.29902  ORF Transcript_25900/g.29902 Transcript_25900/m.29902 type:complete len:89 (+) Transcript_25900:389-655(+)
MQFCHYLSIDCNEKPSLPLVANVMTLYIDPSNKSVAENMVKQLVKFQPAFEKYKYKVNCSLTSPVTKLNRKVYLDLLRCLRNEDDKGK